jgi:multicomponent Na+:H+ antiporter subunit G
LKTKNNTHPSESFFLNPMLTILVTFFSILGAAFFLVAAIGVARLPDLLTRMHAATKAGAFGGGLLLIACALHFGSAYVVLKCLLILIFFYLTAPIAGHVLGRAGYRSGAKLAKKTHRDDLANRKSGK